MTTEQARQLIADRLSDRGRGGRRAQAGLGRRETHHFSGHERPVLCKLKIPFILAPPALPDYNEGRLAQKAMHLFLMVTAIVSLLQLPGTFGAMAADATDPASLWRLAPLTLDHNSAQRKPWVLREREIAVNGHLLEILKDATARPHPRVTVEFFDGNRHELDITSTVSRFNDTAVIRGSFKPPSRGDFTLVASGNLLVGSLQVGDRLYKTEHAGNGRLKLLEVDPRKMPPE